MHDIGLTIPPWQLIFEIRDLRYATPATATRAGILYISEGEQWRSLVESWLRRVARWDGLPPGRLGAAHWTAKGSMLTLELLLSCRMLLSLHVHFALSATCPPGCQL